MFQGGRLADYVDRWKTLTSDAEILQTVEGLWLEFDGKATEIAQTRPHQPRLTATERSTVSSEIDKLKEKGVISECSPLAQQIVSPIFVRPKKDGSHRMIL